jgi:hypothetical protein
MGKKSMVDVRTKGKISYRGYGSNIIPVSTDNPISSNYTLVKTTNPRKYKAPYVDRNGKIHNFMEKVSKPKRRLEYRGSYEVPINSNIPVDATSVVRPDTTEIEYPNFIFGIDNNNYGLFTTGISSDINGNLIDYNNNGISISQEEAIDRIKGYVKSPSERRAEAIEKAFPNREKRKDGGIHIAPSKRGTFTAAATKHGMGVQEFAARVLRNKEDYSPSLVKKANFARNASKWH